MTSAIVNIAITVSPTIQFPEGAPVPLAEARALSGGTPIKTNIRDANRTKTGAAV
jgi:hypothetical protein